MRLRESVVLVGRALALLALVVVLALMATAASAQTRPAAARPSAPGVHPAVLATFFAGAAADEITTYVSLRQGGRELNPTTKWLQPHSRLALVGLASAEDILGAWLILKWPWLRHHPRIATVGFLLVAAERFHLAAHNIGVARYCAGRCGGR